MPGKDNRAPTGENGFGYDPLSSPDGCNKTFAQLTEEEKNAISHRARALEKLEDYYQTDRQRGKPMKKTVKKAGKRVQKMIL